MATTRAFQEERWQRAIEDGAGTLMHKDDGRVAPEAFREIARRHGLDLAEIEAIAAAGPG